MPVDTRELMNAVAIIADEQNMRVTIQQSGKAALITGATTFVGGEAIANKEMLHFVNNTYES